MNKKQQTIETYNKSSEFFASKFNSMSARVDDIKLSFSYVEKTNPKVLELGCGSGRDAKYILRFTDDYLGIDISEGMIREARKNTPEANFAVYDLETFKFPKNLDVVFAFASLLHSDINEVKRVLEKAGESLNENGVFFISLKQGDYREELVQDEAGTRTFYFYTPEEILKISPSCFKEVWRSYQDHGEGKWFSLLLQKKS